MKGLKGLKTSEGIWVSPNEFQTMNSEWEYACIALSMIIATHNAKFIMKDEIAD